MGKIELFYWGLIPSWQSDLKKTGFINARLETVLEKPSFKQAYQKRRCAIICDGYFEWRKMGKLKQPYYIFLEKQLPFLLAGIFEQHQGGEDIETCAILTTKANPMLQSIHDRMPVFLEKKHLKTWLETGLSQTELKADLDSFDKMAFRFFPVSTHVNNPKNEGPGCIQPL